MVSDSSVTDETFVNTVKKIQKRFAVITAVVLVQ